MTDVEVKWRASRIQHRTRQSQHNKQGMKKVEDDLAAMLANGHADNAIGVVE